MLLLVVQVDDFLYTGTLAISQRFEEFFAEQFHFGSFESKCLDIMGANSVQHLSWYVQNDAKETLDDLQPLSNERLHGKDGDDDATPTQLAAYKSLIGKLLYVRRLVSPVIAYLASAAATKCAHLRLHHLKAVDATFTTMKEYAVTLNFEPSQDVKFQLEAT